MSRRLLSLVSALVAILTVSACTERLEGGAACPALCPQPAVELRDTIVDAVVLDSTLRGFPSTGFENGLLLANHGDTLETRVIFRFDSLPSTFRPFGANVDSVIARVDSATLIARVIYPVRDSTVSFTVDAFDVDTVLANTSAADTMVATLAPLFRADRLLGSLDVTANKLADSTLRIPLSSQKLLARITSRSRLRIGLRIRDGRSVSVRLVGEGVPSTLSVRFRVSGDTGVPPVTVTPASETPTASFARAPLADFQIVTRGILPPTIGVLAVGGVPGSRTYLRFELPRRITDSSRVVRAALLLTQLPNLASVRRTDSLTISPEVISAGELLTNLQRAVTFTSSTFCRVPAAQCTAATLAGIAPISVVPAEGGVRTIEIAPLVASWVAAARDSAPRALVLRSTGENVVTGTALFYSREAALPIQRPRVRITYAPRLEFGFP